MASGAFARLRQPMRPAEIRDMLALPEVLRTPDAIMVGADYAVWIRRPGFSGELRTWTRVGRGGAVESVSVPANVTLVAEGAGMVWGILRDAFDVNYVVGMREPPLDGRISLGTRRTNGAQPSALVADCPPSSRNRSAPQTRRKPDFHLVRRRGSAHLGEPPLPRSGAHEHPPTDRILRRC